MPKQGPYGDRHGIHVEWVTIQHRTLYSLSVAILGLAVVAGVAYFLYTRAQTVEEQASAADEPAPKTSASFVEINGNVKVRRAGTYGWINAQMGIPLQREDHIKTDGTSTARVRFFDGTEYLLKPDTIFVIEESYEDPRTNVRRVAVKLRSGQVNLQTPTRNVEGSRSELATPNTEASFDERTVADIRYDESNRTSGFSIFRGSTDLSAGGQRVRLGSSEQVEVSANTFSEIVRLPSIPTVESPVHLSTLIHRNPSRSNTRLKWSSVEGARRYHVMLDRTPNFNDPLWESKVRGLTAVIPGLTPGTYYWKVCATDNESREGGFSDFAKFIIATKDSEVAPPKLVVSTPTATIDGVVSFHGMTDPDAVVTVNNERVSVQPDGSFRHYFMIRSPGRHDIVVKALKRSGGTAEKVFQVTIGSDGS